MTNKEIAIGSLKALTHWMQVSKFDYTIEDLKDILSEVIENYEMYLEEVQRLSTAELCMRDLQQNGIEND
jgi:hypothetical protein|tara:strand:+ start:175 stop:384 length:210 start_codon:yes stop_codon:yes gene_type:complete